MVDTTRPAQTSRPGAIRANPGFSGHGGGPGRVEESWTGFLPDLELPYYRQGFGRSYREARRSHCADLIDLERFLERDIVFTGGTP